MLAGDNRAGPQPFLSLRVLPTIPETSENERLIVFNLDRVRNFSSNHFLPLIETVCRDQAPPFSEGATKRLSGVNHLSPRIDCFEADFLVLSPIRDQARAEAIQTALLGFWVEPNRKDFLTRRDVNAKMISQAQKSAL
jgi:hypothetical protein